MYKVFFNNNVVFLSEKGMQVGNCNYVIDFSDVVWPEKIEEWLHSDTSYSFHIVCDNLPLNWNVFSRFFNCIDAAGGLVQNELDEYLFIFRKDFWDLPKGKCECDETAEICAKREIEEECGVGDLQLQNNIVNTYHTYPHKGKVVLKKTYWFHFKVLGKPDLTPQLEEDITIADWYSADEVTNLLINTYPSIKDVAYKIISPHGNA